MNRISDISTNIGSGMTPSRRNKDFWNSNDIMWLKSEQLGDFTIENTNEYISNIALEKTKIKLWEKGTISIAMYGEGKTRGKVSILDNKMATNQAICNIEIDKTKADNFFLYYWLVLNYKSLRNISNGVRNNLNTDDIRNFSFPNINLLEQKKISNTLLLLDKKIKLNNKINDNLQHQLNTLYDYWFTQYDFPDENGKPYRLNNGVMQTCEAISQNIPLGWQVKKLTAVCNIVLGGTPQTEIPEYWNGNINWLNSGEVSQFPIVETEMKITQLGVDNSPTKLMPIGTTVISITGNIRTSILAIETCTNQSVVGIFEGKTLKYPYLYQFILRLLDRFTVMSTGNCQQHINKGIIEDALVVIPEKHILDAYYEVSQPIYNQILENALENTKLMKLRDWLLPMLMNGQATVSN